MIGLIVEGHGEESAAPVLIRKIAYSLECYDVPKIAVRRIPKSQIQRPGEMERAVEALSRQIGYGNPVVILLDADEDCPVELASSLRSRARNANLSVVVAKREYEAWILASARSLSGHKDLPESLEPPSDPEAIGGAKEWLSRQMVDGRVYSPTRHQAAFSERIDLLQARSCRSFRKFEKEVRRILGDR